MNNRKISENPDVYSAKLGMVTANIDEYRNDTSKYKTTRLERFVVI